MAKKSKTFGSGEPKKMFLGGRAKGQARPEGTLSSRLEAAGARGPFDAMMVMTSGMMDPAKRAQLAMYNPRFATLMANMANSKSAAATPAPTQPSARRAYTPMPAGYNAATQGEWNFFQPKPAATPMKKGGKVTKMAEGGKVVRGDGACIKGKTKGTMR